MRLAACWPHQCKGKGHGHTAAAQGESLGSSLDDSEGFVLVSRCPGKASGKDLCELALSGLGVALEQGIGFVSKAIEVAAPQPFEEVVNFLVGVACRQQMALDGQARQQAWEHSLTGGGSLACMQCGRLWEDPARLTAAARQHTAKQRVPVVCLLRLPLGKADSGGWSSSSSSLD